MDDFDLYIRGLTGVESTATPGFSTMSKAFTSATKFYETAAAEGLIDYDKVVQYPFGYGLSYTTFEQKMGDITEADGKISFEVEVKNTGDVAGKDVVEVYYNPPYTNGGIERASANLIAFEKTSLLDPGASEKVKITFNVEDMASYDAKDASGYVLEKGDYIISINSDAHNIIDSKTYKSLIQLSTQATTRESDLITARRISSTMLKAISHISPARINLQITTRPQQPAPASFELSRRCQVHILQHQQLPDCGSNSCG